MITPGLAKTGTRAKQGALLAELQRWARRQLGSPLVPPQRYGTAFHLQPPVTDLRELGPATIPPELDVAALGKIAAADRHRLVRLGEPDPYLVWHWANLDTVRTRLIHVPAGQEETMQLDDLAGTLMSDLVWVVLEEGAQLQLIDTAQQPRQLAVRRLRVLQHAGSQFAYMALRANVSFLTERVEVTMLGDNAQARLTHLLWGQDREQADVTVRVWHRGRADRSALLVRTAVGGSARHIYRGLIDVSPGASGADGYQKAEALLLSPQAVVDMLPELAIRTNEVRCSHGVTTTHLDDAKLFYLRSRGLSEAAARRLAILGFYSYAVSLPPSVQQTINQLIYA